MTRIIKIVLISLFFACSYRLSAQAQSGTELQHYERKYISFFYPQNYPLNQALAKAFQNDFPRFDYHLASTSMNMSFEEFLRLTYMVQNDLAGQLTANKEISDERFGDKVITWSETQRIAQAAYVFVPRWTFSEISLDGPYSINTKKPGEDWVIHAVTEVALQMPIISLKASNPQEYDSVKDVWTVRRKNVLRIRGSDVIAAAKKASNEKEPIDLSKSLSSQDRVKIFRELRKISSIGLSMRRIEAQNATLYMMSAAKDSMGYSHVIATVRRLSEFLIRAEVSDPNMALEQVKISLGEGETIASLGIKKDASYKIMEYLASQTTNQDHEVGWVKIRGLSEHEMISQPIIVQRDYEIGDQVVEYPKSGLGINLRGGGAFSNFMEPTGGGGALDLDYNIGPALNVSEFYLTFTGGYYAGRQSTAAESPGYGGVLMELGLQKKWFMRQLIFALGLRGGALFAEDQSRDFDAGITGLAGIHWQVSPDFAYGLDAGWRQYAQFGGPVLEGFFRFEL